MDRIIQKDNSHSEKLMESSKMPPIVQNLRDACRHGDIKFVKDWVAAGKPIETDSLFWCTHDGRYELLNYICETQKNNDMFVYYLQPAIIYSFFHGWNKPEMLKILLKHGASACCPYQENGQILPIVEHALRYDDNDHNFDKKINLLIKYGAELPKTSKYPVGFFYTEPSENDIMNERNIILQAARGNFEFIEECIKNKRKLTFKYNIVLRTIVAKQYYEILEYLINQQMDITFSDNYLLKMCSLVGNFNMIKLLVKNGADLNDYRHLQHCPRFVDINMLPLELAINNNHNEIVKWMKEQGAKDYDTWRQQNQN